ncbi:hypothetical protein RISK_005577 [Rhodopirellula islandica]|uniref:Uncharacterized protein n=1 Tax=Rhodopirellula islandica TaxID=595434 RepID=A0A0J1B7U0_RHOIS|nr:hypothetical protein [Rhodopirellula islandica]KLU02511.1 hypothetical protein RISK_005577 [Rhodopirellula islandica]
MAHESEERCVHQHAATAAWHMHPPTGTADSSPERPPSMPIPLLSQADQSHWGLFRQPFANSPGMSFPSEPGEFLFATPEHSQARIWLETVLRNHVGIANLHARPGAGATTWARQWMATHGLDDLPLDVMGTDAADFDRDLCQRWWSVARANQSHGIHTLCIVDGSPPSSTLQWYQQSLKLDPRQSPMTLLVMGQAKSSGVSHSMDVSTQSLAGCVLAALTHAGQFQSRLSERAAQLIAEWAAGNYRQLAFWTHLVLAWGAHCQCQRIGSRDLRQFNQQRQRWTAQRATEAA